MVKTYGELTKKFETPGYLDIEKAVMFLEINPKICEKVSVNTKYFILDKYSNKLYPVKCLWAIAFVITNSMKIEFLYKIIPIIGLNDVKKELERMNITEDPKNGDIRFKIIKK